MVVIGYMLYCSCYSVYVIVCVVIVLVRSKPPTIRLQSDFNQTSKRGGGAKTWLAHFTSNLICSTITLKTTFYAVRRHETIVIVKSGNKTHAGGWYTHLSGYMFSTHDINNMLLSMLVRTKTQYFSTGAALLPHGCAFTLKKIFRYFSLSIIFLPID